MPRKASRKTFIIIATERDADYWEHFSNKWPRLRWRRVTIRLARKQLAKDQRMCRVCLPHSSHALGEELSQAFSLAVILMPGPPNTDQVIRVANGASPVLPFEQAIKEDD